jgi:uncharacterized HAD superfamily protein
MNNNKTLFIDIDGTLIKHFGNLTHQITKEPEILEGVLEKMNEWDKKGYNIILTTGRRENLREITKVQLLKLGIFYDQLIMGIGGGIRILINDKKIENNEDTAFAIVINRNEGLKNINL